MRKIQSGAMLNVYPDSINQNLKGLIEFLSQPEVEGAFSSCYILPSLFNSDLDRGFSIIDYQLNELVARKEDLEAIKNKKIDLKLDFVLNHASVLSPQFQDILKNGQESRYKDFFIDWNRFWEGKGDMTEEGYLQPHEELIRKMFFRKPGLPLLMVRMPNGEEVPYWNTFYREIRYKSLDPQDVMGLTNLQYLSAESLAKKINAYVNENMKISGFDWSGYEVQKPTLVEYLESTRRYLGQMDLNIKSPLVWDYYKDTLKRLADYGASVVRLDAFAYAPKEPGEKNFLNDPGTWDLLASVKELADSYDLELLPEIHAAYGEKIHERISEKGYMTYDFFLPGLIIDALESGSKKNLENWARELVDKKIESVNMLGCHDGIPLLDLKGLIEEERILKLINVVVARGGYVKDLHGQKNVYYQVNATYFSALGEDENMLLLARAIQLFMPGKPQVWYLDLFAGKNDHEAVKIAGSAGHKEINRTNLSQNDIREGLKTKIVLDQLALLRFRNTCPAFGFDSKMELLSGEGDPFINWRWTNHGYCAVLKANLATGRFMVEGFDENNRCYFQFSN